MKITFQNLGVIGYQQAWDYQEELLKRVYDARNSTNDNMHVGYILFCEHPHVYTLGRSGSEQNLLIGEERLAQINATYCRTNRGGDITYHGPGQIVAYPILDLQLLKIGIKEYVFGLEQAVIDTLIPFGISASRLPGASGVWLDVGNPARERKICAIGVRVSRFITMHGLAFNINTNLDYFGYINPCGFVSKGVTSLQRELGIEADFDEAQRVLKDALCRVFGLGIDVELKKSL